MVQYKRSPILSNHERLFVSALHQIAREENCLNVALSAHDSKGTWGSLLQLAHMDERMEVKFPLEPVSRVLDSPFYQILLPSAQNYLETKDLVFVHGYIPCIVKGYRPYEEYAYDANWRAATGDSWERAKIELACKHHIVEPGKTIICGHWHTSYRHAIYEKNGSEYGSDANFAPFYADGIIALDGCTVRNREVNCIVVEDID